MALLQELLKHYGRTEKRDKKARGSSTSSSTPGEENILFKRLDKDVQALVQPYLDSKYVVNSKDKVGNPTALVFRKTGMSFRAWLRQWLRQLVQTHAHGETQIILLRPRPSSCMHWLFPTVPDQSVQLARYD